jgi:hypothetical protein
MGYTYDFGGVKHSTSKLLTEVEIESTALQYENLGLLDPEAQRQEEQSYRMNLENKDLLAAYRMVHDRENDKAFDGTDEELTDAYYEKMRHLEGNFGTLGMLTARLNGDYYSEEEKGALGAMWHNWERTVPFHSDKDQFWKGIGDYAEAAGTDVVGTWLPLAASVASLGFGTPAAIATRTAGQAAARSALKWQLAKYLGKHFVQGVKHGAPWALGHSLGLQNAKTDLGVIDGITLGQTAIDTTIGSFVNGSLSTAFGGVKLGLSSLPQKGRLPDAPKAKPKGPKATPLTPEGEAQTLQAASEFMDNMADPTVVNQARIDNRNAFLDSVADATLENIQKSSNSGQRITQPQARQNALDRLTELGVKDWTPAEILGKLKDLSESHANFSSFAALAVDIETSMYNSWAKAYKEGVPSMEAFSLYNDAVGVASRYSGEAARALNYQKARARLNPDELADVLDSMANTHTADEAVAAFEALGKARWGTQRTGAQRALGVAESAVDVISELRTYNLLSAASTMTVNTFSGYLHMNQLWLQKSLGGITSLNGRELSEGLLQGVNMHRNLLQTLSYMARAVNSSKGFIDRQRSSAEIGDRGNAIAVGNRDMQIFGGGKDGMARQEGESVAMYGANIFGNIWRALGKRGIAGTDEWIKHAQFRTELQNLVVAQLQKDEGLSFGQAYIKSESIVNTLTRQQIDNSINGNTSRNPLIAKALISAREVAFQNGFRDDPAGALGKTANDFIHTGKLGSKQVAPVFMTKLVGNAIAPFVRTPSNIYSHLGEMTPVLQMFSKTMKDTMQAGGPRAREMENKILFGSVLWASAATMSMMNMTSNSGSGTKGQRNIQSSVDGTGYAIVLDDGTRFNIRKGDPYAKPFLIMARIKDVFEYGDEKEQSELMGSLVVATIKSMAEMPTLTGAGDVVALLDEQSAGDAVTKFGNNYATSFMPYTRMIRELLVESGNDVLIPEVLDLYDVLQQPHAFNINGRPDNVKRDAIFGTPVVRNPYAFTPMSGIEVAKTSKDPVLLELKRLHIGIDAPPKAMDGVAMTDYKVDLNSNQNVYDLYQELVGTVVNKETGLDLYGSLENLFKHNDYQVNMNDDLLTYGRRSQGLKAQAVKEEVALFRRKYALDALKLRLGPQHPFIVEHSRVTGLDALSGAGASKATAAQYFPFNKEQ